MLNLITFASNEFLRVLYWCIFGVWGGWFILPLSIFLSLVFPFLLLICLSPVSIHTSLSWTNILFLISPCGIFLYVSQFFFLICSLSVPLLPAVILSVMSSTLFRPCPLIFVLFYPAASLRVSLVFAQYLHFYLFGIFHALLILTRWLFIAFYFSHLIADGVVAFNVHSFPPWKPQLSEWAKFPSSAFQAQPLSIFSSLASAKECYLALGKIYGEKKLTSSRAQREISKIYPPTVGNGNYSG